MKPGTCEKKGSSPRGRGKRPGPGGRRGTRGLIPAWAGKTTTTPLKHAQTAAHPRVGGENRAERPHHHSPVGSSPRGRGKLVRVLLRTSGQRLIPAWAGKTTPGLPPARRVWAHPRVGGENAMWIGGGQNFGGSSPRGRGKLRHARPAHLSKRLIPAWAGKTLRSKMRSRSPQAHPRVGGENVSW